MTRRMKCMGLVIAGGLVLGLGMACTADFGTACDFPASPEVASACGTDQDELGNPSFATCIDPFNPDCDSRLCVAFEGNAAICSEFCDSDADCPSEASCLSGAGMERGVCLPDRLTGL